MRERFLRGLAAAADRPAVRIGDEAITYAHAHETALRWAGALLDAAPKPPKAVAVLADKGPTAYIGVLAALYTGAAVVPLRPDFPRHRTLHMIDAANVSAVIADASGLSLLGDDFPLPVLGPGRGLDSKNGALSEPVPVAAADPAYVLFTSGSTGRPKAVPITHGNTAHYFEILDDRYDFGPGDAFSQTFDLVFDCAMFDLFAAWGAGACTVPVPPAAYRRLPEFLAEHDVTVWFATPSAIGLVRRLGGLAPGVFPGLRWSLFAGEALRCRDAADWHSAAPGSAVENLYGPTELTITITAHRWDAQRSPEVGAHGWVPIGSVHSGHRWMLLDPDGEPTDDAEGELCVTGPQLTPGYLDPADGADRFLHHEQRLWYRTGDRVRRRDDDELTYLGRIDAQVQVRGWRVEPAEIDDALQGCPGVEEAVTVDVPADGTTALVAFYTGRSRPAADFVTMLRDRLPDGLIPHRFEWLATLPRNANRKIDRSALRVLAAQETQHHAQETQHHDETGR